MVTNNIRQRVELSTRTIIPRPSMAYFFPAGGGGTWIFPLAAKSSKLLGTRWFRNLNWIKARFNCCKTGAPALSVITTAGGGWGSATGFAAAGLGAVGDEVFSWVADSGAAVVAAGSAFFPLPQPATKMAVPKTSIRHKPVGFVDGCRTSGAESKTVFI